jgi:2-methylisocitrate lyase-like PEP mutase family enzyme
MDSLAHGAGARPALRRLLARDAAVIVPGVASTLHAIIAEQTGFEAVFTTGAGIANTVLGVPDLGLATLSETLETNRQVCGAVEIPVIADADTGYGNHVNVIRTVADLEQAGVAAVVLEDQLAPKKCGHFDGKALVTTEEMIQKIVAARRARRDPALVLIARTDAVAVDGVEAAIVRANAYARAGADMIFVEAPRTLAELAAVPNRIEVPCLVNMVEGGATPLLPVSDLHEMGYRIVLYANLALRVAAWSVEQALGALLTDGDSRGSMTRMLSWQRRQELVGLDGWQRLEDEIASEARDLMIAQAR